MKKLIILNQKGLSLLEAVTAIGILSFGLLGGLMLTSYSVNMMTYTRHYHEAEQLAQETLEVTRAQRDSNWLAGQSWTSNWNQGPFVVNFNTTDKKNELVRIGISKQIDFTSDATIASTISPTTRVYQVKDNPLMPFFTQDEGSYNQPQYQTIYYRQMVIVLESPGRSRQLKASVVFPYKNSYKAVHLEETIYDWK